MARLTKNRHKQPKWPPHKEPIYTNMARNNYAVFHGMSLCDVTLAMVEATQEGVYGWAHKDMRSAAASADIVTAPLHRATNIYLTDTALPPPEPKPADAQAQEELRTLRAEIESHKTGEEEWHGPWW